MNIVQAAKYAKECGANRTISYEKYDRINDFYFNLEASELLDDNWQVEMKTIAVISKKDE